MYFILLFILNVCYIYNTLTDDYNTIYEFYDAICILLLYMI